MKANELRIGNLVMGETINHVVDHKILFEISEFENLYTPIPITEEWVIKFGLKQINDYWECDKTSFEIYQFKTGQWFNSINSNEYTNGIEIMYVHQLQNLYFALTGNELTIKV